MTKEKKVTSGLSTFLCESGGGGNWLMTSIPLIQCMGRTEAFIFCALDDHYRSHKKACKKDGSIHVSRPVFEGNYGVSKPTQIETFRRFAEMGFFEVSKIKAKYDATNIIINDAAFYIWPWLVYRHREFLRDRYKHKFGKTLSAFKTSKRLKPLYRQILKNTRLNSCFKRFVDELQNTDEVETYGRGKEAEDMSEFYSHEFEHFYDEFMGIYKKSRKSNQ